MESSCSRAGSHFDHGCSITFNPQYTRILWKFQTFACASAVRHIPVLPNLREMNTCVYTYVYTYLINLNNIRTFSFIAPQMVWYSPSAQWAQWHLTFQGLGIFWQHFSHSFSHSFHSFPASAERVCSKDRAWPGFFPAAQHRVSEGRAAPSEGDEIHEFYISIQWNP